MKFLVVVDIQNCFITGGSFAANTITNKKNFATPTTSSLTYAENLQKSIKQMEQICKLMDTNDSFIFTRDLHPRLHFSLAVTSGNKTIAPDFSGVFPKHCRDKNRLCERNNITNKNIFDDSKYSTITDYVNKFSTYIPKPISDNLMARIPDKKIIGTNLSFLYYAMPPPYYNVIKSLEEKVDFIGFKKNNKTSQTGVPKYSNGKIVIPEPMKINNSVTNNSKLKNKQAIELTKGQYCNYESYSAFNYHWVFKQNNVAGITTVTKELLPLNIEYSTGLFEYILDQYLLKPPGPTIDNSIEITACGLAGDICVIDTVVQGLLMWNLIYLPLLKSKSSPNQHQFLPKVVFNYSFAGTLFTGLMGIPPNPPLDSETSINLTMDQFIARLNVVTSPLKASDLSYINFNILDYDGKNIGSISYNGFKFVNKKNNK